MRGPGGPGVAYGATNHAHDALESDRVWSAEGPFPRNGRLLLLAREYGMGLCALRLRQGSLATASPGSLGRPRCSPNCDAGLAGRSMAPWQGNPPRPWSSPWPSSSLKPTTSPEPTGSSQPRARPVPAPPSADARSSPPTTSGTRGWTDSRSTRDPAPGLTRSAATSACTYLRDLRRQSREWPMECRLRGDLGPALECPAVHRLQHRGGLRLARTSSRPEPGGRTGQPGRSAHGRTLPPASGLRHAPPARRGQR
jgi:hypothetical protein